MKSLKPVAILIMCLLILPACGSSVAGNFPTKSVPEPRSTVTGLDSDFSDARVLYTAIYNGRDELNFLEYISVNHPETKGWLDPQQTITRIVDKLHRDSGGMPEGTILQQMRTMDRYKLLFYLAEDNLVVYQIALDVPEELTVNFAKPGALALTLGSGQVVADLGIIVPSDFSPITNWADSRRHKAVLSRSSNDGRPAGWPNIIFVLMPHTSYGQRVVKVTPSSLFSFGGRAALVLE